jgi:glycosyltransferase involved in cell wall biosynthesis
MTERSGLAPLVSVIVPCRNEARFIGGCLRSILGSDYSRRRLEVIVADGRSDDGTRSILNHFAALDSRLRLIDNPEQTTPFALNRAIAAAQGEIVIRFDAHAVMPPDYIRRCVDLLESTGADNAGGAIRTVAQPGGLFAGPIVEALSSRFGVGNSQFRTCSGERGARPADTVFGGCWRRELFSRVGGFNERLARSQDIEFNLRVARAGGRIMLDPQIVCDYYARANLLSFAAHNFSNGVWAVLPFGLSEIVPVRPRHLIPLAFVASLAASVLLPFPWSIAIASLYAAANLAVSARAAIARRSATYLALLPVAFASLHVAYGLGSTWGCVRLAVRKIHSKPTWNLEDRKI